jgi:hypothetical protein
LANDALDGGILLRLGGPLGGVSIFFIIIQPIVIGTYRTLCPLAVLAMLVMIPLTLDEVVAMGQYMLFRLTDPRAPVPGASASST